MKSTFLFNIFFLIILNLIVKPLYIFGIELKIQNVLGEEVYGTYFELYSLVFIFSIINDLGMNTYNTTNISKNTSLFKDQFKNIIGIKLVFGLVFIVLLSFCYWALGYDAQVYPLLFFIGLVMMLQSFLMFIRSNLSGLGMYKQDSIVSILDKLIMVIILGYLLYGKSTKPFSIYYFVYAQLVSLAIAILIGRIILWTKSRNLHIKFSLRFTKGYLKKSLPYAIVFILMTVYSRMDGVMLGRLLSDNGKEAGIYAAGYRLYEAGGMFAYLFAVLLLPMYSKLLKKRKELQELMETGFKLMWVYVISLTAIFIFYSVEITELLYIKGDEYYSSVIMLLIFSLVSLSVSYIYGTLIVVHGSMTKLNWIFIFCILINLVLNLILIPKQAALGAALATFITQMISMIGQIYVAHKVLNLSYNVRMYLKSILFFLLLIGSFYIINTYISDWWISMGINIILSVIIAFFMKMIDFKILLDGIKSKTSQ